MIAIVQLNVISVSENSLQHQNIFVFTDLHFKRHQHIVPRGKFNGPAPVPTACAAHHTLSPNRHATTRWLLVSVASTSPHHLHSVVAFRATALAQSSKKQKTNTTKHMVCRHMHRKPAKSHFGYLRIIALKVVLMTDGICPCR